MFTSLKKSAVILSLASIALLSACSKSNDAPSGGSAGNGYGNGYGGGGSTTPPTSSNLALGTSTAFGSILTDANGKTLYFFANDANGASNCTGGCAVAWPAYYAGNETAPTGLAASDISTITHADGTKQTTYKGWPLYYFSGDNTKGDINGDGSGGTWFVGKPDYSIMLANNQLVGADLNNYIDNAKLGTGNTVHLTDIAGRSLYNFSPDTFNQNKFTKPDLSNDAIWPIYVSAAMKVPSILKATDFVQISSVGKQQLSYKGHPLYYFGGDAKRGDTKGVSVGGAGLWPVPTANTVALTAN